MPQPVGSIEAIRALIRAVITALDHDPRFEQTVRNLKRALSALKHEGRDV